MIGRILLGDASRATLHGTPCPVAVAPHGFAHRPRHAIHTIGVGMSGTDRSGSALELAARLAAGTDATLRLVTAVDARIPVMATTGAVAYDYQGLEDELRRAAVARLVRAADELPMPVEVDAVDAPPSVALEELSEDVDLLVAGSRGRGIASSIVLGSTTDWLVHHARCPVLVAAPDRDPQLADDAADRRHDGRPRPSLEDA